jgi:hypothetical protein
VEPAQVVIQFHPNREKCVIVLADGLPCGTAVSVAAVLALSIGVRVSFPLGGDAMDAAGVTHLALPRVGLPLLVAAAPELPLLRKQAARRRLTVVDYTEAARSPDYDEYRQALAAERTDEHRYLGLALAGARRDVNSIAGNLKLYR